MNKEPNAAVNRPERPMMTWYPCIVTTTFLLAAAIILGACNGAPLPPNGGNQPSPCTDHDDCPDGHYCDQGNCVLDESGSCEFTGCDPHAFCDLGDGLCKESGEKPCISDDDCGDDFICPPSVGHCLEPCTIDGDCAHHLTCNNSIGGCVECTFDDHCVDPDLSHCFTEEGRCVGCLEASHCPGNYYCDLNESSARRHTCREGCLDGNDCVPGTRCERPGDAPGRCVECSVETAAEDCSDSTRQRCHPDLLLCVQCFEHEQCTSPALNWCHQYDWECVQCLQESHCPMGTVCVGSSSTCEIGCTSDARCPPADDPDRTVCDPTLGPHGECVECLSDDECDLGYRCSGGGCVEGCTGDHNCPPHKPSCDLLADRCVECLTHSDCAPRECDRTENACTCLGPGEPCLGSDECGNPPIWPDPHWDGTCVSLVWCISQLKCSDTQQTEWRDMSPEFRCGDACSIPDRRSTCPPEFCCRRVRNAEGSEGLKCVPDTQCPSSSCPG